LQRFDAIDIAALERFRRTRGKSQPGIPSAQVQAFLRKLQEIADTEGIDQTKLEELVRRVRAGEVL
jgi:hypothetical protein